MGSVQCSTRGGRRSDEGGGYNGLGGFEQRNSLMKTSLMKKIGAALAVVGLLSSPAFADKRLEHAVARAEDQITKGRTDEALKTMQKAVSQQPTSPEAHLALARVQQRVGSLEDAAATVAKAVEVATGPAKAEALAALSGMDLLR